MATAATPVKPRLTTPSAIKVNGFDRSWVQIARTGTWVSNRYGRFSITTQDLSEMLHNFKNITPKLPTELPIDYDHHSMDSKQPGDGIAAGWFKALELRENGNELWASVEWTPTAATLIRKKEYRFISPSFVKDHTHKDGKKIGTTLLAAALTNHPFIEAMASVTLYNHSAFGDLAMNFPQLDAAALALATDPQAELAVLGTVVSLSPDALKTPEFTDEERTAVYIVKAADESGQFVRLVHKDDPSKEFGWVKTDQLVPARSEAPSPLPENTVPADTQPRAGTAGPPAVEAPMGASARLNEMALALSAGGQMSFRAATLHLSRQHPELVDGFHQAIRPDPDPVIEAETPRVPTQPGETFTAFVTRIQAERQLGAREAFLLCSAAAPELAAHYGRGDTL